MSTILFGLAATIVFFTVGVHAIAGGAKVLRPIFATDIAPALKWMSALSWHTGTVAMSAIGLGFAAAAFDPAHTDYALIATSLAAAFLVVALYIGIKSGLGLLHFPVVPLFGLATVLGVAGVVI